MSEANGGERDDIELLVEDLDRARGGYPVRLSLADGRSYDGLLDAAALVPPPPLGGDAVAEYGQALAEALLAGPLLAAFRGAWAASLVRGRGLRLRLWLDSDDPVLQELRWELLHLSLEGQVPVALATDPRVAFSRYLVSSDRWATGVERWPLRVLLVVAAPNDLGTAWPDLASFDGAGERQALAAVLDETRGYGQISYSVLERSSPERLEAALAEDYHLVLFMGHALSDPEAGARLLLEHETSGRAVLYPADDLLTAVRAARRRPGLFVLIACNTAAQGASGPAGNLAARLIREGGVPAVVAMQDLVAIDLARPFTRLLAGELLAGGVIDEAVAAARRQVRENDDIGWAVPVLYMRSRDGRLFAPNAQLEYARALSADPLIRISAVSLASACQWAATRTRPDRLPPAEEALELLLARIGPAARGPNLTLLIGLTAGDRSVMMQRLGWQAAASASVVSVSLAEYTAQPGQLERSLLQAATDADPVQGLRLLRLLEGEPMQEMGPALPAAATFLLLFDALDAVEPGLRPALERELAVLAARLPAQRLVVALTADVVLGPALAEAPVVALQPIDEGEMLRYLRRRNPRQAARWFQRLLAGRLLDLCSDPALLTLCAEHLARANASPLRRDLLLRGLLDQGLGRLEARDLPADAASASLVALGWALQQTNRRAMPLGELYALLAEQRQGREYSLDALREGLVAVGLLAEQSGRAIGFVHPALQAYCAALALAERPDRQARLVEIVARCSSDAGLSWWDQVLRGLSALLDDPTALLQDLVRLAALENSGNHALLGAQCAAATRVGAPQRLDALARAADLCAGQLDPARQSSPARRAQAATALGQLPEERVAPELARLLAEPVRQNRHGARYDYGPVRLAAARALRNLGALSRPLGGAAPDPAAAERLRQLLAGWLRGGPAERVHLRAALADEQRSTIERIVSAFALGDVAEPGASDSAADVRLLFELLLRSLGQDNAAAMALVWACADALALFPPAAVVVALVGHIEKAPPGSAAAEPLVAVAGRVRAGEPAVLVWLLALAERDPRPTVRGAALQALGQYGTGLEALTAPEGGTLGARVRALAVTLATHSADEPETLYLRRKAIELLGISGGEAERAALAPLVAGWPLELREAWQQR